MRSKIRYGFTVHPRGEEPARLRRTGSVVYADQVHGGVVLPVDKATVAGDGRYSCVGEADGLITNQSDTMLVIHTADCVPVLFWDDRERVVGAAHAGWRGVLAGIIPATIAKLDAEYGVDASRLHAAIGPAICGSHYDVSTAQDGRVEAFEEFFAGSDGVVIRRNGRVSLDLPIAVRKQCLRAGMSEERVLIDGRCTFEDDALPSHRREGEKRANHVCSWILIQ